MIYIAIVIVTALMAAWILWMFALGQDEYERDCENRRKAYRDEHKERMRSYKK